MKHQCTGQTDVDELLGHDEADGFHDGPLLAALRHDEPLVLEFSECLTPLVAAKLERLSRGVLVVETGEWIDPPAHFRLVFR